MYYVCSIVVGNQTSCQSGLPLCMAIRSLYVYPTTQHMRQRPFTIPTYLPSMHPPSPSPNHLAHPPASPPPPRAPCADDDNDAVLFDRIKRGAYDVDDCIWDDISPEAKHLVAALLTVDASKRYTAAQALDHPWLKQHAVASSS